MDDLTPSAPNTLSGPVFRYPFSLLQKGLEHKGKTMFEEFHQVSATFRMGWTLNPAFGGSSVEISPILWDLWPICVEGLQLPEANSDSSPWN